MSEATYVPCPHCGHPYPMSPMQKDLYRGRTLSCNNCAKSFSADNLTPAPMATPRAWSPAAAPRPAAPAPAPVTTGGTPPPKRMSGWGVVALSVGGALALIVLLILVLLPPLRRAREQNNRVTCASNMRQVGQAMFIYASVNGGRFPDTLDKLLPYVGSGVFVCPSCGDTPAPGQTPQIQATKLYAGGHLSYVYVGAGLSTTSGLGNASTTVVLYEPLTNHQDGMNVLYADGSVTFLPRNAAMTMMATLPPPATQPATAPAATSPAAPPAQPAAPAPTR